MMRPFTALLFALTASMVPTNTQANDSSAHLASGGLEFVRQKDVVMQSEDLYLSPDRIDVRYVFRNTSSEDITTLVAFPLPDIEALNDYNNLILPQQDAVNFIDFTTKVDGRKVEMEIDQRAIALGVDRTAVLREFGVPLEPYLLSTHDALAQLAPERQEQLRKLGLLRRFDGEEPGWLMRTAYYWTQTFPAGQAVVIEHSYKPVAGRSLSPPLARKGQHDDYSLRAKQDYCISDDQEKAIASHRLDAAGKARFTYFSATVEYILKTGGNWSGPIRNFHLVVEAAKPDDFALLCLDGAQRVSRSRLEFSEENFWPRDNLNVLFIDAVELH
ncbi:DUF4424 domain-containing protein [uncultured Roseibium sp.]|uniref:DUF4424 domain-containing protein n=1 Tax=uncultured Roseibium sp. TaxID=1936171 RepID=UPI0032177C5B